MADLSPVAQAVVTALTQQEYGLDPADIPNEAGRMACIAAAALRAAGTYLQNAYANEEPMDHADDFLLDLANELEQTND